MRWSPFKYDEFGRYLALFLTVSLFVGGGLFFLWPRVYLMKAGYELDILYKEKERTISRNRMLRLEVASFRSLDRIEPLARKMGMKDPSQDQIIHVLTEDQVKTGPRRMIQ